jgi:sensor histidine kinase YesM
MDTSLNDDAPRWRRVVLFLIFWTLIGLSFAGQFYISSAQIGRPVTWQQALGYSLADWYVFAVLSTLPLRLARHLSLEGERWVRNLCVHMLASVVFSMAYVVLRSWVGLWQGSSEGRFIPSQESLRHLFLKTWHFNLLIYWVVLSVAHALEYYRRLRERTLRAAELEKSLMQAKLQALQMQLNPHFLFNSLHAIAELMHRDVEAADRMLTRLSELLRVALDSSDTQEVTLREEVRFLSRYLEIEQTRFGSRLSVSMAFPNETLDATVPNLILQPLVENAIRHGIEPCARPGRIEMSARRVGDSLELTVCDNGRGFDAAKSKREGIGLSNTRARLRELYGERQELELAPGETSGIRATIRIPWIGPETATGEETPLTANP